MPLIPSGFKHTQITLAGNRVLVKIPAVSAAALGANVRSKLIYKVKVFVETIYGSGKFEEVASRLGHERAPRVKNGITYLDGTDFDIGDILQAYMPDVPYNLDQYTNTPYTYSKLNEHFCTLKYYYTTECETLLTSPVSSAIYTAINGHLSKTKFASWKNTFFTTKMDDTGQFLTWSPKKKYITTDQNEYLFYLQNIKPTPSLPLRLKLMLYTLEDGILVPHYFTLDNLPSNSFEKVYTIPVGYTQLNILYHFNTLTPPDPLPADYKLHSYSVYIEMWDGIENYYRVSEEKHFILKQPTKHNPRHVTFRNSLGAYDTVSFFGVNTESTKVTKTTAQKAVKDDGLPSITELETTAVEGVHEMELNTGYFEFDANYLLELLYSDDIRIQTTEGLLPLQLDTEALQHVADREFIKNRTFKFRFSNTEIAGSFLGTAAAVASRPTGWTGIEPFCQVNENGIYNGFMKFNSLQLRYTDGAQEAVEGAQPKLNIEGTEGYIAPVASPQCLAALTPITNTVQSRLGTYKKNTCVAPQVGDYPTITIAAGTYGGATLAQANQRALDAITALDTQAYANTGAGAAACITGPWAYSMAGIPTNKFNLRWGQRPGFGFPAGNLTGIQGGPGASSGAPADLIYGNYWVVFQSTNAGSIYFAPQLWDNLLPTVPGGSGVYEIIVHTTTAKTLNLYKNGTLVLTNSITLGDLGSNYYKKINLTGMTYTTGDRYYADII